VGRRCRGESARIYSYVIGHDFGFAPKPFHGICSLACCKPNIRKTIRLGEMVIGTGSKPNNMNGHLCYWMRVDEIITFDEYRTDLRFRRKQPKLDGSLESRHGDNIYRRDSESGSWL
jgi:hypothetical protein